MKSMDGQIRFLTLYVCLLAVAAAVGFSVKFMHTALFFYLAAAITAGTFVFGRGVPRLILKLIMTFVGFSISFVAITGIVMVISDNFFRHASLSTRSDNAISTAIALGTAFVTAGMVRIAEKRSLGSPLPRTPAPAANGGGQAKPAVAVPPRRITHSDAIVQQIVKNYRASVQTTYPLSRFYGSLAGELRAAEAGQDKAKVKAAGEAIFQLWTPPTGVKLLRLGEDALERSSIWDTLEFRRESELMGATAEYLRALEVGKSTAEAEEAAKRGQVKWAS